jgi:hypothetical protein
VRYLGPGGFIMGMWLIGFFVLDIITKDQSKLNWPSIAFAGIAAFYLLVVYSRIKAYCEESEKTETLLKAERARVLAARDAAAANEKDRVFRMRYPFFANDGPNGETLVAGYGGVQLPIVDVAHSAPSEDAVGGLTEVRIEPGPEAPDATVADPDDSPTEAPESKKKGPGDPR